MRRAIFTQKESETYYKNLLEENRKFSPKTELTQNANATSEWFDDANENMERVREEKELMRTKPKAGEAPSRPELEQRLKRMELVHMIGITDTSCRLLTCQKATDIKNV